MSSVLALSLKGRELTMKGHHARAAEKYRLAAEEAEKALLSPDSLVTYALRYHQLDALVYHAKISAVKPADADDALRKAFLSLLPSVLAVLERRKAAGTLLPGSCRPVEEAYHLATKRRGLELQGCTQARAAENAAVIAPFVGIEIYIRVAATAAFMFNNMASLVLVSVVPNEQMCTACLSFIASALDLVMLPRDHVMWLCGEPELVHQLRMLIPAMSGMDDPEAKIMCAAWRRLLSSGVLRARGIDEGIVEALQFSARVRATADADRAAGRLQQCALAGCAARESHASQFKRCGACKTVVYCSREHQVEDWPSHKAACKAARKTAADSAGAPDR